MSAIRKSKKPPAARRPAAPTRAAGTGRPAAPRQPAAKASRPRSSPQARAGDGHADAAAALAPALRALAQVTEGLHFAEQSFADALLRLPRPEDYEPLVSPLREFARVSPALVDALREVIQAAGPLAGRVEPLRESGQLAGAGGGPGSEAAAEALAHVDAAREAVRRALADLPRDADYGPVAEQLRAIASVSPSLLEWLKEVPKLTTPLAGSLAALRDAAGHLEAARDLLATDSETGLTPRGR